MEAKRNSSKLALHLDSAIAPVCLTKHDATQSRKTKATKASTRKEANTECKTNTCMYVLQVCMYVRTYVRMYVCMYFMYVCMYVCIMRVCEHNLFNVAIYGE
jgi:hypothetical protein